MESVCRGGGGLTISFQYAYTVHSSIYRHHSDIIHCVSMYMPSLCSSYWLRQGGAIAPLVYLLYPRSGAMPGYFAHVAWLACVATQDRLYAGMAVHRGYGLNGTMIRVSPPPMTCPVRCVLLRWRVGYDLTAVVSDLCGQEAGASQRRAAEAQSVPCAASIGSMRRVLLLLQL